MNLYQQLIKELLAQKEAGIEIGNAIMFCSQNAFELQARFDMGESTSKLVEFCLANK